MREETAKLQLKNAELDNLFNEMKKIQKIFKFDVPKDVLQDIAELELTQTEEKDYTNLNNGLKMAIIGKRLSMNQSLIIQQYVYNGYVKEKEGI